MREDLYFSKIRTNVPGFDDLFYGGLRLPDIRKDKHMKGICIVIYGERGVSKSDLAMQIMRGVDNFFKINSPNGFKLQPRFYSMNHRQSEWKKHYRGAEIVDMLDIIKAPEDVPEAESVCKLCDYFKDLRSLRSIFSLIPEMSIDGCRCGAINTCPICKLVRHGLIVYNYRSQSLHWNVGNMSDMDNYLSYMSEDAIDTSSVFNVNEENESGELFEKTSLQMFNDMQEKVYKAADQLEKTEEENRFFYWSACVIESFTAFRDDDLERLPYADLMRKLRQVAAVSIMVFDERGAKQHLNADIIIHMTQSVDTRTSYQYKKLRIVKSDYQPHVQGWHKYRTIYGMKVLVYPSIPYLLMSRFEIDNAVTRLEHESLRYPQWLLHEFQTKYVMSSKEENTGERVQCIVSDILSNRECEIKPYDERNTTSAIAMIETPQEIDGLYRQVDLQLQKEDTTVVVFLLGKTEQEFRKFVVERNYPDYSLDNIHCWEATSAYVWPEIFASVVRQYVSRWKRCSTHKHLHIIIDDFANISLYPLMNNEPLLPSALVAICRNATILRGMEDNSRGIHITLSMVCTSSQSKYYQPLLQLKENQ